METYNIFNPVTGSHIQCVGEEELKTKYLELVKAVLNHIPITIVDETVDADGNSTWTPSAKQFDVALADKI